MTYGTADNPQYVKFVRKLYAPAPDRRPTNQRHLNAARMGCVLSVARIPWLRTPLGVKVQWPQPRKYKTPLVIEKLQA